MDSLRLGLTMRVVETREYEERRDALAHDWPLFMRRILPEAGWMPLPNIGKTVLDIVHAWNLNGFIITGGNDLHEYLERDETELALIEFALKENLPIFGVCRGFQIMANFFGIRLKPCVGGHAGTRHAVRLMHMQGRGAEEEITVNSYHNHCGPGAEAFSGNPLVPFALDALGRVEGFRHKNKPMAGVMWHPEREKIPGTFDTFLIHGLFMKQEQE